MFGINLSRSIFDDFVDRFWNNDQSVFVEEECSEVIKEICKVRRGKSDTDKVCEEICDVIASGICYMHRNGYSLYQASDYINNKYRRAIERDKNGEIA